MRLNCHILMDELTEKYEVKYYGARAESLHLRRPEIFDIYDKECEFMEDRVYCLPPECVPDNFEMHNGALLICVSPDKLPDRIKNHAEGCIWLKEDPKNVIKIFNDIQSIFDKYDDWEQRLQKILYSTANIQEMIDISAEIIDDPVIVIDASLHFLAYSGIVDSDPRLADYRHGEDGKIQQRYMTVFMDSGNTSLPVRRMDEQKTEIKYFCQDIVENDVFLGNMCVPFVLSAMRYSDPWILSVLCDYVSHALTLYKNNPGLQNNILRSLMQNLVSGKALEQEERLLLKQFHNRYICLCLRFFSGRPGKIPLSHLCSYVENFLGQSVCFEYENKMIAFYEMIGMEKVPEKLFLSLAEELHLYIGCSCEFTNLSYTRYYYEQAYAAQKLGRSSGDRKKCYFFEEYLLSFLLRNCMGGAPAEIFFSNGLKKLAEHDLVSKISYMETLRIYLDNCMNSTKTALDLHIHRTSFLERLRYIESMLDKSLDDPEYRLYLQIMLKIVPV